MNPTPAYGRPEWLNDDVVFTWRVRLIMIGIGVGLWVWAAAWSVSHRLERLRWRLAVKGQQP